MTQEALKLALEALEQTLQTLDDENAKPGGAIADTIWHSEHETLFDYLGSEITAIKEALAQPDGTAPQPAQRKPLTDNELADLWYKQSTDWLEFARAIEAAYGIKENT